MLSLTSTQFRHGIARFRITASDGEDISLPHSIQVQVVPVNSQPTSEASTLIPQP